MDVIICMLSNSARARQNSCLFKVTFWFDKSGVHVWVIRTRTWSHRPEFKQELIIGIIMVFCVSDNNQSSMICTQCIVAHTRGSYTVICNFFHCYKIFIARKLRYIVMMYMYMIQKYYEAMLKNCILTETMSCFYSVV